MVKMPRKKVITEEERLQNSLSQAIDGIEFVPEPTYNFNVGDIVQIGRLKNAVVIEILYGGKIYRLDYIFTDNNWGNPVETRMQNYFKWFDLRPVNNSDSHNIMKNQDLFLNYSQRQMQDLFGKKYLFGINMNPVYQREYVWTIEDQVNLIDSIFKNIDIGKFVFIKLPWQKDSPSYEILDGKQRIKAICDFFENRFAYNGLYFNDLSVREQDYFESYGIVVAEIERITEDQKLRLFLRLNTSGKIMAKEQLDKVEQMLKDLEK